MPAVTSFAAPRLASNLLVDHLQAFLGPDVNYAAILQEPTWQNLAPLWDRIIERTFGITREQLKTPMYGALDALQYPELHDDAIYARATFVKARKIAKMARLDKFSIRDLTDPGLDRLTDILSNIVNFQSFLVDRKTERWSEMQRVDEANRALGAELHKKEQLAAELQDLKEKEASEQTEAGELRAQAAALDQAANDKVKQAGNIRQQLDAAQHKINDYVQNVQQVKTNIQALRMRKDELKNSLLPESPSKVQEKLQRQAQQIVNTEQCISEWDAKRKQLQKHLHDWNAVNQRVQTTVQRMVDTEVRVAAKKMGRSQLKQLLGSIADLQQQASVLQVRYNQLQIQHAAVLAKRDKLISEAQAEIQLAEQEVASIRGAREVRQRKVRTKQTKIAELSKQIAALQQQRADVEAQCEAEARALTTEMDAVRQDLLQFKASIDDAFYEGTASLPDHAFRNGVHPARSAMAELTNTTADLTTDANGKLVTQ